jgi:Flp pilus assembly protein TadG
MTPTLSTRFTLRLMRRLAGERGQSMVEFAIVLPVLLMIIVGILSFGRYMNYASQQTQLAETAARYAALDQDPGGASSQSLQTYVQAQATGELQAGSSSVTSPAHVYLYTNPIGQTPTAGTPVVACVVSTVSFLSALGMGSVTSAQISEQVTMRVEQAQTTQSGTLTTGWTPVSTLPAGCH